LIRDNPRDRRNFPVKKKSFFPLIFLKEKSSVFLSLLNEVFHRFAWGFPLAVWVGLEFDL